MCPDREVCVNDSEKSSELMNNKQDTHSAVNISCLVKVSRNAQRVRPLGPRKKEGMDGRTSNRRIREREERVSRVEVTTDNATEKSAFCPTQEMRRNSKKPDETMTQVVLIIRY